MRAFLFSICVLAISCSVKTEPTEPQQTDQRPNIVLIMGDDIGFSDLACYGGEIPTPNLDRLAAQGMRFQQFYNMSKCETTRSVLHTGLYRGDARAQSMGGLLRDAGYSVYHFGKEHFQEWVPPRCYAENYADESVTFWATTEFFIPPDSTFDKPFFRNGVETPAWQLQYEQEPFYKTDMFTDYAVRYLDSAYQKDAPFFLYMPYHSAHYPLQARPEDIDRFRGKYMAGWDSLRQARYQRMIALGVLDEKHKLSEPTSNINRYRGHPAGDDAIRDIIPQYRPWNSLSEQEKEALDLEMAVYAAMVYRLDQNIGRIIQHLEANGKLDNTLIMYLSDNGSCPYDSNRDFEHDPGPAESYRTLSAPWANLGNTPFRYFKQYGHEGGAHTHFIAHWPAVIKDGGGFTDQPGHVVDLMPTLLEIAGVQYPQQTEAGLTLPLDGTSLVPVFQGEEREEPAYFVSGFSERFPMYRQGDWKIVKANGEAWELYNIAEDMTENHNLASERPEKVQALSEAYAAWKASLPGKAE
jgi:arylsulfatase